MPLARIPGIACIPDNTAMKTSTSSTHTATGAALLENNEAPAKLTTANGATFTSSSARLSSQSCYRSHDQ